MALQSFLDSCAFTPTASGSGTWTVSAAIAGYLTPAQAGAVDGRQYTYRAENAAKTEWEIGHGIYTVSGTTLTRVPLFSSNSNAAVSFTAAPNVFITLAAEDLPGQILLPSTNITVATAAVNLALPSGYKKFRLDMWGLDAAVSGGVLITASSNGGSSYYTGGSDYQYQQVLNGTNGTGTINNVGVTYLASGGNPRSFSGVDIDPGDGSYWPSFLSLSSEYDGGTYYTKILSTWLRTAVVINAIQISAAGNLTAGGIRLWGTP